MIKNLFRVVNFYRIRIFFVQRFFLIQNSLKFRKLLKFILGRHFASLTSACCELSRFCYCYDKLRITTLGIFVAPYIINRLLYINQCINVNSSNSAKSLSYATLNQSYITNFLFVKYCIY